MPSVLSFSFLSTVFPCFGWTSKDKIERFNSFKKVQIYQTWCDLKGGSLKSELSVLCQSKCWAVSKWISRSAWVLVGMSNPEKVFAFSSIDCDFVLNSAKHISVDDVKHWSLMHRTLIEMVTSTDTQSQKCIKQISFIFNSLWSKSVIDPCFTTVVFFSFFKNKVLPFMCLFFLWW